jgi:acetyl-CoA C-acetyltransferase/acetyl-CoA acyltransferase 2
LSCQKELSIPSEKLNIWGGALALGHPLAASGNRIALSLARQLKANGLKRGIASACIGGGQGIALLIEVGE